MLSFTLPTTSKKKHEDQEEEEEEIVPPLHMHCLKLFQVRSILDESLY